MINKEKIKRPFLDGLNRKLQSTGFVKNISNQALYRKMSFGRHSLHVSFIDQGTEIGVVADVAIRHDVVENLIFENTSFFIPKDYAKNTNTLGSELGRLMLLPQKRWTIFDESDMEDVLESLSNLFFQYGLPYLEKYSEIETLFAELMVDGPDTESLSIVPLRRSMNVLALSFLLKKGDLFYVLGVEQEDLLRKIPNGGVETFIEFRENLKLII